VRWTAQLHVAVLKGGHHFSFAGGAVKLILIVDDDPSVAKFLERGLSFEGFETIMCITGEEAVSQARTHSPHLVILDWMLPGIQGDETMIRLREACPGLPVIVLSARDTNFDIARMKKTGANVVLTKPIDFDVLLNHVRTLLEQDSGTASGQG
jgi:DNA-binding response OmpR family regulator